MFLKRITLLLLIINCYKVTAQNNVDYSLYNYSLNLINPAFAGQKKHSELLINSKMQWVGIENAPKASTFSLNIPLKNNIGVGVNVINDKIFIFNQTKIALDFSYKLKITNEHDLQFGLKALGNIYSGNINTIKTEQQNDLFFSESINKFSPNFTIGAAITHEDYYTHLAINNLLIDSRYSKLSSSKNISRLNISLGGGYIFTLNNTLKLVPSTLIRIEEGVPLSFDINSTLKINEKHRIGLSYFWNNSVSINGLLAISNTIQLGYGYRLTTNDLSTEQNGTHEFIILFNMDNLF
ncbi:PorP/SprF family type IX secretion system membrane protein [Tenacibaculum maritimum]|uniref:PorP/SprF family type IX secretion system membrane protein n=1 Tax=Tenacibaculum maritimum TaxID=107401 RepID=UPI0012E5A21B|nr:PorP/SprF family type IX secretion system membrane protein [Tenacibaculum maritimum]CAA0210990.1 conserved exported hypothetical protein [Tenacibaculum maritimum]